MNRIFRSAALRWLLAIIGAACFAGVHAQTYPSKPIRLIVPYSPGGSNDVISRVIARGLTDKLGQPVIVENKVGAGGNIGGAFVANAPADGYTLLAVHNGMTIAPWIQKNMGYDPIKMEPVLIAVKLPMVITVSSTLPVHSVQELMAYAKANPGKLSYATPGVGTAQHLAGELFKKLAGIEMVHVPYKGAKDTIADMTTGRVQVLFSAIDSARPHIQAGAIRAIAVAEPQRLQDYPNLPTVNETIGGPFEVPFWLGVMAPAGTPQNVTELLAREMTAVLEVPETKSRLGATGMVVDPIPPAKMRTVIDADYAKWGGVVKSINIQVN